MFSSGVRTVSRSSWTSVRKFFDCLDILVIGMCVQLSTDIEGSLRLHSTAYSTALHAGNRAVHR